MKNKYIDYQVGYFKDFKGKEHTVTVAAISEILPKINDDDYEVYHEVIRYADNEDTDYISYVKKILKLGYAICNPEDKFDPVIGSKKSLARAERSNPVIWATDESMINSEITKAYMSTLLRYICNSPEKYIKGYKESKLRYEKQQGLKNIKNNFNKDQLMLHDLLKSLPEKEVDSVLQVVNDLKTNEIVDRKNN